MRHLSDFFLSKRQKQDREIMRLLASFTLVENMELQNSVWFKVMKSSSLAKQCFEIAINVRRALAKSLAYSSGDSFNNKFEQELSNNWEYNAVFGLFSTEKLEGVEKCSLAVLKSQSLEALEDSESNALNRFRDAYARHGCSLSLQAFKMIQEATSPHIPNLEKKKQEIQRAIENLKESPNNYLKYIREAEETAEKYACYQAQRGLITHFHQLVVLKEVWDKPFAPAELAKSAGAIAFMLEENAKRDLTLGYLNIPSPSSYKLGETHFRHPNRYGMAMNLVIAYLKEPEKFTFNEEKRRKVLIAELIDRIRKVPETNSREVSRIFNHSSIDEVLRKKELMSIIERCVDTSRKEGLQTNSIFMTHQIIWQEFMQCIQQEFFENTVFFDDFFQEFQSSFGTTEEYVQFLYELFNPPSSDELSDLTPALPNIASIPTQFYEEWLKVQIAFIVLCQGILKDEASASKTLATYSFFKYFTNHYVTEKITNTLNAYQHDSSGAFKTAAELIQEAIEELNDTIKRGKNSGNYQQEEERIYQRLPFSDYTLAYDKLADNEDPSIVTEQIRRVFPSYKQDWDKMAPNEIESSYIQPYIAYMLNKTVVSPEVGGFLLNQENPMSFAKTDLQRKNFLNHISLAWEDQITALQKKFNDINTSKKHYLSTDAGRKKRYEQLYIKIEQLYVKVSGYPSFESGIKLLHDKFDPVYPKDAIFEAQFQSEYFKHFSEPTFSLPAKAKQLYWDLVILGKTVSAIVQENPCSVRKYKITQTIIQSLEKPETDNSVIVVEASHPLPFIQDCLRCIGAYFDQQALHYHKIQYARALAVGITHFVEELQKNEVKIYSPEAQKFLKKIARFPVNETLNADVFYRNVNTVLQSIIFCQRSNQALSENNENMIRESTVVLTQLAERYFNAQNGGSKKYYFDSALQVLTQKNRPNLEPMERNSFYQPVLINSYEYKRIKNLKLEWEPFYSYGRYVITIHASEKRLSYSSMCADLLREILTRTEAKQLKIAECFLMVRVLKDYHQNKSSRREKESISPFYRAIHLLAITDSDHQDHLLNSPKTKELEEKYCSELFNKVSPFLNQPFLSPEVVLAKKLNNWDEYFQVKEIKFFTMSQDFRSIQQLYGQSGSNPHQTKATAIRQFGAIQNTSEECSYLSLPASQSLSV